MVTANASRVLTPLSPTGVTRRRIANVRVSVLIIGSAVSRGVRAGCGKLEPFFIS